MNNLRLNTLAPSKGTKRNRKRVGRGDKTAGRGHKGQKARSGFRQKTRFEGGQMPLHRRVPKLGFTSRMAPYVAELRVEALSRLGTDQVTLVALKEAKLVRSYFKRVRIIGTGSLTAAYRIDDPAIKVTAGAKAAIEAASGSVSE